MAEDAAGAGAGAVGLLDALVEDPAEEVEVHLHADNLPVSTAARRVPCEAGGMLIGLAAALGAAVLFGISAVLQAVAVRRSGMVSRRGWRW